MNKLISAPFMADCQRQNVGICLDPRQMFRDEHTFDVLEGQDAALLPYAQINDQSAVLGNAGTLPGEGALQASSKLRVRILRLCLHACW